MIAVGIGLDAHINNFRWFFPEFLHIILVMVHLITEPLTCILFPALYYNHFLPLPHRDYQIAHPQVSYFHIRRLLSCTSTVRRETSCRKPHTQPQDNRRRLLPFLCLQVWYLIPSSSNSKRDMPSDSDGLA